MAALQARLPISQVVSALSPLAYSISHISQLWLPVDVTIRIHGPASEGSGLAPRLLPKRPPQNGPAPGLLKPGWLNGCSVYLPVCLCIGRLAATVEFPGTLL